MTFSEYCEYIRNPLAEAKARVLMVPPGENWTALRRFCQERGDIELRLSELVREGAWLPMPDEVFGRVRDVMTAQEASGKAVVLLGMPGYLALLRACCMNHLWAKAVSGSSRNTGNPGRKAGWATT